MESGIEFVKPKVYLIGQTMMDLSQIEKYLEDSGAIEFLDSIREARFSGLSDMEILSSFFAKLCYKSFVVGNNKNINKTRSISDNIKNCFDTKHGSVFEHVIFNFVIKDCSRIFTHELVRHRVGTAFSQYSGRYIREDLIKLVRSPDIEYSDSFVRHSVKMWESYKELEKELDIDNKISFSDKKRLTSSLRRILPNCLANDIGFSVNVRELRHVLCMRTSRHAEWEMRYVFDQVYNIISSKFGSFLHGLNVGNYDGFVEIEEKADQCTK